MDGLLGEWVMVVRLKKKKKKEWIFAFGVGLVVRRMDDGGWVGAWG